ncbi:MAG TPA: putative Fe-S cluster assembly protein SufT [Verrucomicrobiales bacterium]|jgi:probable FeS assembly SUF system protein SufT|nr:putative Fe-S cluster assembly protein SufT [Verrucomicrobiales bacterium]
MNTDIELLREVEAIQIPSGDTITLPAGTRVIITQSLGGSYTVATDHGLARISSKNADALGLEKKESGAGEPVQPLTGEDLEKAVWEAMKTVFDPEIPVNIVDLGLVYDCSISKEEDDQAVVNVKMTLTAPGCGMGPTIAADAQGKIMSIPGVSDARVEIVWDPAWNQGMISEVGRMQLGMV